MSTSSWAAPDAPLNPDAYGVKKIDTISKARLDASTPAEAKASAIKGIFAIEKMCLGSQGIRMTPDFGNGLEEICLERDADAALTYTGRVRPDPLRKDWTKPSDPSRHPLRAPDRHALLLHAREAYPDIREADAPFSIRSPKRSSEKSFTTPPPIKRSRAFEK